MGGKRSPGRNVKTSGQGPTRATERACSAAEALDVLESLPEHVALLDGQGCIVAVNRAWRRFAEQNGGDPERLGAGADYLRICRQSLDREDDPYASVALDGLRKVLAGELREFRLHYPCNSPERERWFLMQAVPLRNGDGAVISHLDVSERHHLTRLLLETSSRLESVLRERDASLQAWSREACDTVRRLRGCLEASVADQRGAAPDEAVLNAAEHLGCLLDDLPELVQTPPIPPVETLLPEDSAQADFPAALAVNSPTRRPRLLLAEEDPLTAFVLRSLLDQAGYAVDVREDGPAALEALRSGRYDLLLVDAQLPFMDGIATARAARAGATPDHPCPPIICLAPPGAPVSDYATPDTPFDACVAAPHEEQELLATIRRLLLRD